MSLETGLLSMVTTCVECSCDYCFVIADKSHMAPNICGIASVVSILNSIQKDWLSIKIDSNAIRYIPRIV